MAIKTQKSKDKRHMRTDKARNVKLLKRELLKQPLQTEEELAKKLKVNRKTINRLKTEMPEIVAKQDDILSITATDKEIIELSQFLSKSKLTKMKESVVAGELIEIRDVKIASDIAKESTARYTIFKGSITNPDGGLNTITSVEIT